MAAKLSKTNFCVCFYICSLAILVACKDDESPPPQPPPEQMLQPLQQPQTESQPAQQSTTNQTIATSETTQASTESIPVETEQPVIRIVSRPGDRVLSALASFEFTVSDASPVTITCQLDASGYESCDGAATYSQLSVGPHTFYVKAIDSYGNTTVESYSWRFDFTLTALPLSGDTNIDNIAGATKDISSGTIYTASWQGLGITTDDGASWSLKQPYGASSSSRAYGVSMDSMGTVFLAAKGALSITNDDGVSFTNRTASAGLGASQQNAVFIDLDDSQQKVYAGNAGGLGISDDHGTNFTTKTSTAGLGADGVYEVIAVGSKIYACTAGGLSISTDSGLNFSNKTSADGLHADSCTDVSVGSDGTIVASNYLGFSISTDDGASFSGYSKTLIDDYSINNIFYDSGVLYIATSGGGLYLSTDGGSTFTVYNPGNSSFPSIYATHIDQTTQGQLLLSSQNGLAVSISPDQGFSNLTDIDGPVVSDSSLTKSSITSHGMNLTWTAANDSSPGTLQHQVYHLAGNDSSQLKNVADCYQNGTPFDNYSSSTSLTLSGLNPGSDYIVNVVVKDSYGNKSTYSPVALTTLDLQWTEVTTDSGNAPNWHGRLVSFDSKMWILGGYDTTGDINTAVVNEVHHSTDGITWTAVTQSGTDIKRYGHSATVFENKIWVIGGVDSNTDHLNDVITTTDGATWNQETASAPFEVREEHGAVVFDNKLWVIGGRGDNSGTVKYLKDVWYYSGASWIQKTAAPGFQERHGFGLVVFNGKMWVIGGKGSSGGSAPGTVIYFSDVWSSSDGQTWTEETGAADFGTRGDHGTFVHHNKIWVVGGSRSGSYISDAYYSTDGSNWYSAGSFPGREWAAHTVFEDKLWIYHGAYYGWPTSVLYGE